MEIVLKPDLEKIVNERIQKGGYRSPGEVIEQALHVLVDRDETERRLETLVREGEESGDAVEMTDEVWEGIRRQLRTRNEKQKVG